nr:cell division protein ZapE [Sphingorhabdus sp.]
MTGFYARYQALIANGELKPDPDQEACAQRLAILQDELEAVPPRGS